MKFTMTVVAAAISLAAVAQGPARPMMGPAMGPAMMSLEPIVRMALNPKTAEKIGVTAEQVEKLKSLPDNREALKGLHEKARKGMERQAELLKSEKVDEAAVMAALEETWNARKEVAKLQTKRLVAVRSILTVEQIAKAREAMKATRGQTRSPKAGGKKAPQKGECKAKKPAEA